MPAHLVGQITSTHFYNLSALAGVICALVICLIWSRGL